MRHKRVRRLILPATLEGVENDIYLDMLIDAAGRRSTEIIYARAGDIFIFGDLMIECLYPFENTIPANPNEHSLVKLISYGNLRFMMTGDIAVNTENEIINHYGDFSDIMKADVLKVSHHGSRHSSSERFLNTVGARYGIISVGRNPHGHPTREAVARIEASGAVVLPTIGTGAVIVTTDGVDYSVKTMLGLELGH